jgi:hypothetical protein
MFIQLTLFSLRYYAKNWKPQLIITLPFYFTRNDLQLTSVIDLNFLSFSTKLEEVDVFCFDIHNNILAGSWMKSELQFSCAYASTTMMQVAILK